MIALFGKTKSILWKEQLKYAKRYAKQQSIIALRHEGQSILKMSRTFKVSSSVVTKTIKRYGETGPHEDHQRKLRCRVTSAAEDKLIRVNCTSDCSPNKCFTELK